MPCPPSKISRPTLRHQAFHDSLTGLPNRALLHERIDHALAASRRTPGTTVLCFCDLDGFKAVNDSIGHQAGDELLIATSHRLTSAVRDGDTVARLGGDEFAILLDNVESLQAASEIAQRVVTALRQPVEISGQTVSVSASVGVALAEVGTSTRQLLSEADLAMYDAKASGKDRYAVFQAAMQNKVMEQLTVKNSFPGSLLREEFLLEYQPQVGLDDDELTGFEALVRWNHPELGRIDPARFIGLAEDTGFIVPLGRWILETACVEAADWQHRERRPVSISVNVSACQLDTAL